MTVWILMEKVIARGWGVGKGWLLQGVVVRHGVRSCESRL